MSDKTQIIDLPPGANLLDLAREKQVAVTCKYVVVRCSRGDRLVFGPVVRFPYHADLLCRFCDLNSIAGGWENRPDHYVIYDFDCNVAGGGWLEYSPKSNSIRIFGASKAYGAFDHQEASQMLAADTRFSGFGFECAD